MRNIYKTVKTFEPSLRLVKFHRLNKLERYRKAFQIKMKTHKKKGYRIPFCTFTACVAGHDEGRCHAMQPNNFDRAAGVFKIYIKKTYSYMILERVKLSQRALAACSICKQRRSHTCYISELVSFLIIFFCGREIGYLRTFIHTFSTLCRTFDLYDDIETQEREALQEL